MTVNEADSAVWEISDIEGDASNWTLSSDVNMLNLLETFSGNLMSNLNSSSRALEELLTFSEEVSTKVNNTFNEFNMLSNAQFIESRVYEDDETNEGGSDILPDVKEEDTSDVIGARIKTSVEYGLTVLDAAYTVHGYNENSLEDTVDDQEEESEMVLEPNDPYTHRTLPYLIGSSEYCTEESVGITLLYQSDEESSKSEDEEEEDEDEEDDETTPETPVQDPDSEEEPDEDSEAGLEERLPSVSRGSQRRQPLDLASEQSSESEEMFPEPRSARTKVFDSIFDSTDEEESEEETSNPPAPASANPEPTPEPATRDERSQSVLSVKSNKTPKGVPKGAISIFGGRTVFEGGAIKVLEDEESEEEEEEDSAAPQRVNPQDDVSGNSRAAATKSTAVKTSKNLDSLFNDSEESDSEDLFSSKNIQDSEKEALPITTSKTDKKKSVSSTQKQAAPKSSVLQSGSLFESSDEEEEEEEKVTKKPPSGAATPKVSSKALDFDLFDSNESDEDVLSVPVEKKKVLPAVSQPAKKNEGFAKKEGKGLFDSSDDETDSSLFGSVKVLPTPSKKSPQNVSNTANQREDDSVRKDKAQKVDSFDRLFGSSDDETDDLNKSPKSSISPTKTTPRPGKDDTRLDRAATVDKPKIRAEKFDDIFGDSDEEDDVSFGTTPPTKKKDKPVSLSNQSSSTGSSLSSNKNQETVSKEKTPAKTNKFDDLFGSSDDEDDIFSGTKSHAKPPVAQPKVATPNESPTAKVEDDVETSKPSKETSSKQNAGKTQDTDATKTSVDKIKARGSKFDDIFGGSDDDEEDMFLPPEKMAPKNVSKQADTLLDPEVSSPNNKTETTSNEKRKLPSSETGLEQKAASKKIETRAAKFDDLFGDSDDDEEDMISPQKKDFPKRPGEQAESPLDPNISSSSNSKTETVTKETRKLPASEAGEKTASKKIEARAAKFDDLFGESDEDDDMFSFQQSEPRDTKTEPKKARSDKTSTNIEDDNATATQRSEENHDRVPVDKVKARAAKFDDLFAESDEEDVFSIQNAEKVVVSNAATAPDPQISQPESLPKPESQSEPKSSGTSSPRSVHESSSPKTTAAPTSNISKLQSNLNISPAMLMGGPRPKKPKDSTTADDTEKPEDIPDVTEKPPETETRARAAKFDDLFGDSDEEDIFSPATKPPKGGTKPRSPSHMAEADIPAPVLEPPPLENEDTKSPADKIKARAAKFDDLFGESEDDADEDIFSTRDKSTARSIFSGDRISGSESPAPSSIEQDSGPGAPKSKASPNSNIAKLQSNLKFNPAMLMGGPRPPLHKQTDKQPEQPTPAQSSSAEGNKVVQEAEKSESQAPKVLSSITKGRTKRGGRRPPSRAPTRPSPETVSDPSPATVSEPSPATVSEPSPAISGQNTASPEAEDIFTAPSKSSLPPSMDFEDSDNDDDIFAAPSKSKSPRRCPGIIQDDDIFSALPKSKTSIPVFDESADDIFSSPPKTKSSSGGRGNDDMQDIFSSPSDSKSPRKDQTKTEKEEDDLFTAPSKPKSSSRDKVKNDEEEEDLFTAPSKPKSSSRDHGKAKSKSKKMLDDDLFGSDFDLFSDIPTKSKQSKKEKKGTKGKKTEASKSRDFIDPLFQ